MNLDIFTKANLNEFARRKEEPVLYNSTCSLRKASFGQAATRA